MLPSGRKPFVEDDFRLIAKLGFNFVRLPMDYRFWIKDGNWEQFDEATLQEIDQAVAVGRAVRHPRVPQLPPRPGLHRRPAAGEDQPVDRPRNAAGLRHALGHVRPALSRHPQRAAELQPDERAGGRRAGAYVAVVRQLVAAIRAEDPQRLIISDGLQWGQHPVPELRDSRVAQATRGYAPMEITHYKASWVNSANFPDPRWPRPLPPNGTLLSPHKKEGSHPLVIDGPFPAATELRLHVLTVSAAALLVVEADGQHVFEKKFLCGPGEGEWKKAEFKAQYNIYQNLYDRDYTATIPAGTRQVRVRVADGDWLQIGQIGLEAARRTARRPRSR